MTEFTLTPRTAFGQTEPLEISGSAASLTERPDMAIASVAARKGAADAVESWIERSCGAPCPVAGYATGPERSAFWSGPDQWFVMQDGAEALASRIKAELGDAASVTDQSGGWVLFDLTGETLAPVLERLCNIDLNTLSAGKAQRTVIEHIGCFVLCETPQRSYRLLCGQSYALSFVHAIETAMNSVDAFMDASGR